MEVVILDLSFYELCVAGLAAASVFLALLSILKNRIVFVLFISSLCLMAALLSIMYVISPNALIVNETINIEGIGSVNATRPVRIKIEEQRGHVFSLSLIVMASMYLISSVGVMPSLTEPRKTKWNSFGAIVTSSIIYIVSLSIMVSTGFLQVAIATAFIGSSIAILLVSIGILTARRVGKYAVI